MCNAELSQHRITTLEDKYTEINTKLDTLIAGQSERYESLLIRVVKLEERQMNLQKIVYGAIGVLVSLEMAGLMYVLQRVAEG